MEAFFPTCWQVQVPLISIYICQDHHIYLPCELQLLLIIVYHHDLHVASKRNSILISNLFYRSGQTIRPSGFSNILMQKDKTIKAIETEILSNEKPLVSQVGKSWLSDAITTK